MKKKGMVLLLAATMMSSVLAGGVVNAEEELTMESLGIEFLVPDGEKILNVPEEWDGRQVSSLAAFSETITSEDLQKIVDGGYTAAYCTFDSESYWGRALEGAITDVLEKTGIELLTVTDCAHDVQKAVENFENAMQLNPDVMIVASLDVEAEIDGWREAIDKGIKLVFVSVVPAEFEINKDYYGCVAVDNYSQVYIGAKQMLEAIGGEGEVIYINMEFSTIDNVVRQEAFADACAEYPNVTVLDKMIVTSLEEASTMAESLVQAHPNLKGMCGLYDELVLTAMNTVNDLGMNVVGGTCGISESSCLSMAQGTGWAGSGAEAAYDMGCSAAIMAAAALADVECPEMVVTPTILTTAENIEEGWYLAYHQDLPEGLQKVLDAAK